MVIISIIPLLPTGLEMANNGIVRKIMNARKIVN